MSWQFYFPGKVYFGNHAIEKNYLTFKSLGTKALIVIGQGGSARRIGALDDVFQALELLSISWEVFDQVEANPSIDTVREGAARARSSRADFVIGIGGGSPLDAAKSIAILAANDISDEELLAFKFNQVLPIVAIPTTAGTGSEITPYSILTYPALETKKSVASEKLFPRLAFLDPRYTVDLPYSITVDTAVDAYSHALESFLAIKATRFSEMLALEALRLLGAELKKLASEQKPALSSRETLLYGSMLAGMAISITGTSIPHALGYSFTYFKEVPHGRANGLIMPGYLHFSWEKSSHPKISQALQISGFDNLEQFKGLMLKLCGKAPYCSQAEKEKFISQTLQAKNLINNITTPTQADLVWILEHTLA